MCAVYRYNNFMQTIGATGLFGTATRTATLLLISMLGETHAAEIGTILGRSRSRIKDAVDGLERVGVIIGMEEGKSRRLRLNPRYVAAAELESLLSKLATLDVELQKQIATKRRRPRKAGKDI
jgi:hypothetical protein